MSCDVLNIVFTRSSKVDKGDFECLRRLRWCPEIVIVHFGTNFFHQVYQNVGTLFLNLIVRYNTHISSSPKLEYHDRRHDPTPSLKSLHWLPVRERIVLKILLLVYKSFHDQAPIYIKKTVLSCTSHLDQIFVLALTHFVFAVPEFGLKQAIVPLL